MNELKFLNIISILGWIKIIKYIEGLPTVFLFDEQHGNLNECIDKNILNALLLIESSNISLIGVESKAGGVEWDLDTKDYVKEEIPDRTYLDAIKMFTSACVEFEKGLPSHSNIIIGVESERMHGQITIEVGNLPKEEQNDAIASHHLTIRRSEHFIRTLAAEYVIRGLSGNLILNCGKNHNSRIETWIRNGEIDEMLPKRFNFIRINTIFD